VAALAGIDLQRGDTGGANPLGVVGGLLVALDDADRHLPLQRFDGPDQQRGLARTGTRHEVERKDAPLVEPPAVGRGIGIVLGENVLLDLHHARLAHAGRMDASRAGAVIEIAGDAVLVVTMFVPVRMGMRAAMLVRVARRRAVVMNMDMLMRLVARFARDLRFSCSATANRTHRVTSRSPTRSRSP
jgi:hypothetical protein